MLRGVFIARIKDSLLVLEEALFYDRASSEKNRKQ